MCTMCIAQFLFVISYGVYAGLQICYHWCCDSSVRRVHGSNLIKSDLEECIICFEEMGEKDVLVVVNRCGHTFHLDCMKEWNNHYNQSCPICRRGVGIII